MRILYDHQIFKSQKFGGISRYFTELMKMDGVEVDTINPDLIPDLPLPSLFERGTNFIKKRAGISVAQKVQTLPNEVIGKISNGGFDIFHPTYFDPYFLSLTKKPVVVTVYDMLHEIYPESFYDFNKISAYKHAVCKRAAKILAISHTTKNDLVNIFKIPAEKVTVTYLASDFDKTVAQKPASIEGVENYILFTGGRGAYKNFYFAVRALADILKTDRSLQLLCTGSNFSAQELDFFKELEIQDQVKHAFLQNDNELAWAYQNARCFIFPSLYEGFGFPLLEAFASNCPVVSSTGGSLKEIGGEGVIFFDPKNIQQLQDAVSTVLYNPSVKNKLVIKGKKEFAKYSWQKCRAETLAVYKSLL